MTHVGAIAPCPPKGPMDWQALGACRGEDPSLFEEVGRGRRKVDVSRVLAALVICDMCPVRAECLAFGVANKASGVYGATYLRGGCASRWPKR